MGWWRSWQKIAISLAKKNNNHSTRKTQVQTLCATGVSDSAVMQLSGHKSVQSLNHYKRPSLEQEKHISHLLSNYHPSSLSSVLQPPSPPVPVQQSPLPVVAPLQRPPNSVTLPPPIISQNHASPSIVDSIVQSHSPIVSENQAPPPIVASTVQSHPSIFGQGPVPSQSPVIPPSVQSPFQQLVTNEQMNLELSASSQGLFMNGSFMSCTFNFNLVQKQKHTKRPRVIYSDSEEDWLFYMRITLRICIF